MKHIRIEKERKVITYSDLWATSEFLLESGSDNETGSYYMFLSSLMFKAFSLEAFLNHIGEHLFDVWGELEKSLSPNSKLCLICEKLDITVNYGKMPWQIVPEIIGFRNKLAHGKSSLLREQKLVPVTEEYQSILRKFLLADWQEYANEKNALRAQKQLNSLFEII